MIRRSAPWRPEQPGEVRQRAARLCRDPGGRRRLSADPGFNKALPDGSTVPMWGFASCTTPRSQGARRRRTPMRPDRRSMPLRAQPDRTRQQHPARTPVSWWSGPGRRWRPGAMMAKAGRTQSFTHETGRLPEHLYLEFPAPRHLPVPERHPPLDPGPHGSVRRAGRSPG